jgi:TctA family transporter
MIRFRFNRPALLLGFVLGGLFEKYFLLAYKIGGPLFFLRPISIGIIILIIAGFLYGPIKRRVQRGRRDNTL